MIPSSELVAQSWTTVAAGYNDVFVSRFAPWTTDCFEKFKQCNSCFDREGVVIVPCCGPGQELIPMAELVGGNVHVLGIDIAPGMIDIANQRVQERKKQRTLSTQEEKKQSIRAVVGDCSGDCKGVLEEQFPGLPCVAILSIFGLQQMPDPPVTLGSWVRTLEPGGTMIVCYWPQSITASEEDGPWTTFSKLVKSSTKQEVHDTESKNEDQPRPGTSRCEEKPEHSWDGQLVEHAVKNGAHVLEDKMVQHKMVWDSGHQFWNGMTKSGPWHKLRLTKGGSFVDGLGEDFVALYSNPDEPIVHYPTARILVLKKTQS